jgi:hypothetical protein
MFLVACPSKINITGSPLFGFTDFRKRSNQTGQNVCLHPPRGMTDHDCFRRGYIQEARIFTFSWKTKKWCNILPGHVAGNSGGGFFVPLSADERIPTLLSSLSI